MLENISSSEIKNQFKTNKKLRLVSMIVGGIIILVSGYFVYNQFISKPKELKSQDAYWEGLNFADQDSTDMAISTLEPVVKKYDGYKGGENAQFILGRQYMEKGQFKKAIETLEGVKTNDLYLSCMSIGLQGDCYSELGKYKEAGEKYLEAADENINEFTTPNYLFKAGLCAEELADYASATTSYQRIKDDYPAFAGKKAIDKYIARVANQK